MSGRPCDFFPNKTLSCIWVAISVDWIILHWYACRADGRSGGRADTSLTKFSYLFFKEKPLWYGLSLIGTTDTKSRPQRAHSYKLNLFITDTTVIRWICTGWILSGWWAMQGDFKSPVAVYQTTICERCTEEHNRLNFKGWITTDSR